MTGQTTAARQSADRRGQTWQRDTAQAARPWFPSADHVGRFHGAGLGDITGVGDRIIECTVQPMNFLAEKLRQAEADAIRAEFNEFYVVKKAVGAAPGKAYMITRAGVLWPLLARLDRLEAWEAEQAGSAQDARDAGYREGYRDGLAARDGAST